jgi:hypothetical protein
VFLTIRDYPTSMNGVRNQSLMNRVQDHSLEYTFDTLLKTFNPNRKPIMKKAHFYKMMDILDTKLRKQGVDIKYPSYWYRYGAVTDFSYLDQVLPKGFNGRYFDGEYILFPSSHRINYNVDPRRKVTIDSTINFICEKYRYTSDYIKLLKKDSYQLNSPYSFNTTFQEYIDIVNEPNQATLFPKEEVLEILLDRLLEEFPEDDFPELLDINLAWDDTTRLVLDYPDESKDHYLKILMNLFWSVYSKGIRSIYNRYFPADCVIHWQIEYEKSIPKVEKNIEKLRKEILLKQDRKFNTDEELVKKLLKAAYNLNV